MCTHSKLSSLDFLAISLWIIGTIYVCYGDYYQGQGFYVTIGVLYICKIIAHFFNTVGE